MNPPMFHKHGDPSAGEKKSTAKTKPEPGGGEPAESQSATSRAPEQPSQFATTQPTPPAGYTVTKTITISVYTATAKPPMFYVVSGSYNQYHGSQVGVQNDVRNQLHAPAPSVA